MISKIRLKPIGVFVLLAAMSACTAPTQTNTSENSIEQGTGLDPIPGQYIVVLKSDSNVKLGDIDEIGTMREEFLSDNAISEDVILNEFNHAFAGFSANLTLEELERLENDERVEYIEQDYLFTLAPPPGKGPGGGSGGGGTADPQETPWGINRVNGVVNYTGNNVAWVVDSGIDLDHPDLNVDVNRSQSFIDKGRDANDPNDYNGHGSHVAGTIAAINNTIGVIGVAPGATVISMRVLDRRGSGSFSWTIAALDHIFANGASGDVVNMSLGPQSRYTSQAVDDAVLRVASRGIKLSLAAGNESDDALFYSPARTNGTNVYTISAMDINNRYASFSNYGSPVDYAAPGVGVKSTYMDGGYATLSGTSMAAPHAAGLLLLGGVRTDGNVLNDPDGNADPIIVH